MSKAVVYNQYGNPPETVNVVEVELGAPGPGEALVTGITAPINPADLNTIEGKYPIRPTLPATPGVEGAGVVTAVGPGVTLTPGTVVLLPHGYGTWREAGILVADALIPVPEGVPFHEAAMLKINPATAWRMLHDIVPPKRGSWVIQNAANSGVGRSVIAIAKKLGLRTVNLVRRPELIDELTAAGADVVVLDDETANDQIKAKTERAAIHLGLNAVGGDSATRVASALAKGGSVVTYGAMSRQPLKIPTGLLIFKDIRFQGFWVTKWYETASAADRLAMFAELFELARAGAIQTPVEQVYPVEAVREAVAHALKGSRGGKILLGAR
ncbi:MAG: 2-enoyl thioester reductase domain-containing protein [Verrucomicrobiota bacterium]